MGTMTDTTLKCAVCSAEVSWADCDKAHADCYQTECDNPLGCGNISRDCEDVTYQVTGYIQTPLTVSVRAKTLEHALDIGRDLIEGGIGIEGEQFLSENYQLSNEDWRDFAAEVSELDEEEWEGEK